MRDLQKTLLALEFSSFKKPSVEIASLLATSVYILIHFVHFD